jgi:hypothetical protein
MAWLAAATWAWWRARERFYAQAEGLLRLETHLGWHNVLSAAAAGGVAWPALPDEKIRAVEWRWGPSARPLLASLVFLLAGMLVPVGAPPKPYLPPPAQLPLAVQEVEKWTDVLKEQKLVEPAMMETWEQRLEQLKNKPAQDWYGQESLEAAESLHNQMAKEMDTLGKNLKKASDLLDSLQSLPSQASASSEMAKALNQQAAAMENSELPLRADLAREVANAKELTPQQLAELKRKLENSANALSSMQSGALPLNGPSSSSSLSSFGTMPNGPLSQDTSSSPGSLVNSSGNNMNGTPGLMNSTSAGNLSGSLSNGLPGLPSSSGQSPGSSSGGAAGLSPGTSPGAGAGSPSTQSANGNGPGQAGPHGNSPNNNLGSDGPGGGGGSAGLTYQPPTDLQAQNKVGVSSQNQNSPQPGDMLSLSKSAPPKNTNNDNADAPGGAAAQGSGGDPVWRQELTPQERDELTRYFK